MAGAAGYPVSQIQSCSQFKRVHYFLLEAWEATYMPTLFSHSMKNYQKSQSFLGINRQQNLFNFLNT